MSITIIITGLLIGSQSAFGFNSRVSAPSQDSNVREFHLVLEKRLSMAYWRTGYSPPILYNSTTKLFHERIFLPFYSCSATNPVSQNLHKIPTTDGRHRTIAIVNGSIPGPTLTVYQNDTVIVRVQNLLDRYASIHWHGLEQRNTFFMDGVSRVSQCGIEPLRTFTYKFTATNSPGTYWYHDDAGSYRGDGLFGAFVILEKETPFRKSYVDDHVVFINDWQHQESRELYEHHRYDEPQPNCDQPGRDFAGVPTSINPWVSGLINGRGWYDINALESDILSYPLSKIRVDGKGSIKLRLINSGTAFSLMFEMSSHQLEVIASDGHHVKPINGADFVILSPGERFDVFLHRNPKVQPVNHVIRVQTLEYYDTNFKKLNSSLLKHYALALLSYDDPTNTGLLDNTDKECNEQTKCLVVNCPFQQFPADSAYLCINIGNGVDNAEPIDTLTTVGITTQELFLNLHYEKDRNTINGIQMVLPAKPIFLTDSNRNSVKPCSADCGKTELCSCSSIIRLEQDGLIQLVLTNKGRDSVSDVSNHGHPFHMHGHEFYVMQIGYPLYWANGTVKREEQDTICPYNGTGYCNFPKWSHSTWSNGSIPGIAEKPPLKDTIFVPYGGYVIIRFRASNPGYWLGNSQVLSEQMDGMTTIFQVGNPENWPKPAGGFHLCGINFGQLKALRKSER